jgi:DNA-binding protein HU-beta
MNKAELVEAMSRNLGSTKAEAERALDAFTTSVATGIKKDQEVSILGFGTFRISRRSARAGVNPKTGEKIQIGPSIGVAFRAGKALKESLNG